MCCLLYTNLQNKTPYRRVTPFSRSPKSQHEYIVSKNLGWKLSPINNTWEWGVQGVGDWNKNVVGGKKSKNYLAGERALGTQE